MDNGVQAGDLLSWPLRPVKACDWFAESWDALKIGVDERSEFFEPFVELVRAWGLLEAAFEYENPKKGFSKKGRPEELSKWISNGRWRNKTGNPPLTSAKSFGQSLRSWWASVQPAGRVLNDCPDIDEAWETVKAIEGWESLCLPGNNGMLSFLAGAKWWGMEIGTGEQEEWQEFKRFVDDMIWVIRVLGKLEGAREMRE
ncbi:hypothetical protein DL96DRAFT_1478527 [Flagelloscypha sp. PMI_526]|nr:hypothetical protein DL96DRAFT_1478527 [Flagelloscypha sp. PMI_526]